MYFSESESDDEVKDLSDSDAGNPVLANLLIAFILVSETFVYTLSCFVHLIRRLFLEVGHFITSQTKVQGAQDGGRVQDNIGLLTRSKAGMKSTTCTEELILKGQSRVRVIRSFESSSSTYSYELLISST